MIVYSEVLRRRWPDAVWALDGESYDGLVWLSDSPKPSQADLDAAWAEVDVEMRTEAVQQARQVRYRHEADPLFFEAQRGEDGVTLADWEAKVAEIKADLPYPS